MISEKEAETFFWIFFTKRQLKILKTITALIQMYCLDFKTFKKYLSHDTIPLKDRSGYEDMTKAFLTKVYDKKSFFPRTRGNSFIMYCMTLRSIPFPNSSKMRKIRQFGIIGVYTIFSFFYKSLNKL